MNMNLIALNLRPLLAILVSLVASGLIYVLGEHIKANTKEAITFTASILKMLLVYSMVPAVLTGQTIRLELFRLVDGISFALNVDTAGIVFCLQRFDTLVAHVCILRRLYARSR